MGSGLTRDVPGGREVLDTAAAAELLGVHPKLLARWAKQGKLPCRKPGKGYLFSRTALLAWLACPQPPDATRATSTVGELPR